jgi:hypothetical protein
LNQDCKGFDLNHKSEKGRREKKKIKIEMDPGNPLAQNRNEPMAHSGLKPESVLSLPSPADGGAHLPD